MQTYDVSVHGQNVTVNIDSHLYDPKNRRVLGPYSYFERGTESPLGISVHYGKRRRAFGSDDLKQITHFRGKAGSHIIRQLVSCLAAYHSRVFDVVHGTGLLMDSRKNFGLLIIGASGSGKSTLSSQLGDIIMDDDMMLVTRDRMRVAGKMGFVSCRHPESGRKYLTPLPNGVKEAHLGLVFLLDRKQEGGTVMEVDTTIPRKFACLDDVPPLLKTMYLRMPPIKVDARIYRLGTRGRLQKTLSVARQIISQHF